MAVYVVDDDTSVNDALTILIEQLGHEVVSYPNARSLFEHAPPTGSDIVLLDLKLPGISGREAIRWLKRLEDPPRIIPISGWSRRFVTHQLEGTGLKALHKPLSYDKLMAALKSEWS